MLGITIPMVVMDQIQFFQQLHLQVVAVVLPKIVLLLVVLLIEKVKMVVLVEVEVKAVEVWVLVDQVILHL